MEVNMTIIPPDDKAISKEVVATEADITEPNAEADTRYVKVATPLIRLGYPALPINRGKAPIPKFAYLTSLISAEEVLAEIQKWGEHADNPRGALWTPDAISGTGMPDLDVIDVDDPAELQWVIETFGEPPLMQKTGRPGGGFHLFYLRDTRRPRDERGSFTKIGGHKVDLRTWHGYIVAPGSPHTDTGTIYLLYWKGVEISPADLTADMIRSLPVLDRDVLDRVHGPVGGGPAGGSGGGFKDFSFDSKHRPTSRRGTTASGMERVQGDPTAIIPLGQWKGRTPADVAAAIYEGEVTIACPHRIEQNDGKTAHKSDVGTGGSTARLTARGGFPSHTNCFACNKTYRYTEPFDFTGESGGHPVEPDLKKRKVLLGGQDPVWNPSILDPAGYVDKVAVLAEGVKPHYKTSGIVPRVIVVQTGTGSGKTHLAASIAAEPRVASRGEPVVAVAPLRSLTRGLSARVKVNGKPLPYYEDSEGKITGDVATCFPSTPRVVTTRIVPDDPMEWDGLPVQHGRLADRTIGLLVWDESEASLRGLVGHLSAVQGARAYVAALRLTRTARMNILTDADAGPCTRRFLADAGLLEAAVWIQQPKEPKYTWVLHPRRTSLDAELLRVAGEGRRIGIACGSAAHALALGATVASTTGVRVGVISPRVGEVTPGQVAGLDADVDRVGIFAADGSFDLGKSAAYDLADISWVNGLDVLLITWAAGTGVDVPGEWDRVAYVGSPGVPHTVPQVRQMLGRWRRVRSKEVHTFAVNGKRPAQWMLDPAAVLKRWEAQRCGLVGSRYLADVPRDIRDTDAQMYIRACATAWAANRSEGHGWLRPALLEDAQAIGEKVEEASVQRTRSKVERSFGKTLQQWKKAHKDASVDALLTAPTLPPELLTELRERGPSSPTEARVLRRDAIDRFYGAAYTDGLTGPQLRELIQRDERGRRRSALRPLAYCQALLTDPDGVHILAAYDVDDLTRRVLRPDQIRSRVQAAGTLVVYLKACGIDPTTVEDGMKLTAEMASKGAAWIQSWCQRRHGEHHDAFAARCVRTFREVAEVRVGNLAEPREAVRLMTDALRSVGMAPTSPRVRGAGGRVMVHTVQGAELARQDVAHYLQGLLNPEPGSRKWVRVTRACAATGGVAPEIEVISPTCDDVDGADAA